MSPHTTPAGRPYHATAADRLARIEALPFHEQRAAYDADPMAKALSHKRDRWYAVRRLGEIAPDDDARHENLSDLRDHAAEMHRLIIERLWLRRKNDIEQARMIRAADACVAEVNSLVRRMSPTVAEGV